MMKLAMMDVGSAIALIMVGAHWPETGTHDHGQEAPVHDVEEDVVHGVADECAVVPRHRDPEIGRKLLLQPRDLVPHRVGHTDGVAPRLLEDVESDRLFPLDTGEACPFFHAVGDGRDISEMDRLAARSGDNDLVEIVYGCELPHGPEKELPGSLHEVPRRDFHVRRRKRPGRRPGWRDCNPRRRAASTSTSISRSSPPTRSTEPTPGTFSSRFFMTSFVYVVISFAERFPETVNCMIGWLAGSKPRDHGIFDLRGKVRARRRDLFPHLLRSHLPVDFQLELGDDDRQALPSDVDWMWSSPADRIHRVFDLFRDIRFDLFRSGPAQVP